MLDRDAYGLYITLGNVFFREHPIARTLAGDYVVYRSLSDATKYDERNFNGNNITHCQCLEIFYRIDITIYVRG